MTLPRRTLLQLSAAGVVSVLAGPPAGRAAASPRFGVVALVGGSALDAGFLAGVGPTEGTISLAAGRSQDWGVLESSLDGLSGRRLVGLLDPGRQAILDTLLQGRRTRVLCVGEHSGIRHRFATAPAAHGVGTAVARGLSRAGHGHAVQETGYGENAANGFSTVPDLAAADWAGLVGQALGRVAEGSWEPGESRHHSRVGSTSSISNDSLVSFVVHL